MKNQALLTPIKTLSMHLSNNRTLVAGLLFMAAFFIWPAVGRVYADYGGDSQVQSFFDGTAGFLVKTVGTGVFILGLIAAGIKIASGDHNGLRTATMVMVGGAIIFLAKPLVSVLSRLAGSN